MSTKTKSVALSVIAFIISAIIAVGFVMQEATIIASADNYSSTYGITEEQLFKKYPAYLWESGYLKLLSDKRIGIYDDVNSNTDWWLTFSNAVFNGAELVKSELLSNIGLSASTEEKVCDEVVLKIAQSIEGSETSLTKYYKDLEKIYKTVKVSDSFDLSSETGRAQAVTELCTATGKEPEVVLPYLIAGIEFAQHSKNLFGDSWKYIDKTTSKSIDVVEIVAKIIEIDDISSQVCWDMIFLFREQGYTELENAAIRLYNRTSKGLIDKAIDIYFNDEFVGDVVKLLEKGTTISKATKVMKSIGKVLGCFSLMTDITDYMKANYSAVASSAGYYAIMDLLIKSKKEQLSDTDIEDFQFAYSICQSALSVGYGYSSKCVGKDTKKAILRDKAFIENSLSYDDYILDCMKRYKNAKDNNELITASYIKDEETGNTSVTISTSITPERSYENILERFGKIQTYYPPNAGVQFLEGGECFGFAKMVFRNLFDRELPGCYYTAKKYEYANNGNVGIVGQLEGADVTVENLDALFSKAKLGDIIQACGKDFLQHTMVFVGYSNDGVKLYDANFRYSDAATEAYGSCFVHQRTYSLDEFAGWYDNVGSYNEPNGVTLYHAVNYEYIYGGEAAIFYDDSVNFVINDGVLTKYNGTQRYVEIPDEVTAIGDNAFKNNDYMVTVSIPDGVSSIGNSAFYDCDNLTAVILPDSVETVGSSAFYSCDRLGYVYFSKNLTLIGKYAFQNSPKLDNIEFPNQLETIDVGAFDNCDSISSIFIPSKLSKCGTGKWYGESTYGAFSNCDNLLFAEFEYGATTVWGNIFRECVNLQNVIIPETVNTIEKYAFYNCQYMDIINIPSQVINIEEYAFANCTLLNNVIIPSSITKISSHVFFNCVSLDSIIFPDSITDIGWSAFENCINLSKIVFSNNLKTIEGSAFANCKKITSIYIPQSLQSCDTHYSTGYGVFRGTNIEEVTFEKGISKIAYGLLYGCESLKKIEIPETITEIGYGAFMDCKGLKEIVIPSKVTAIGGSVFQGCSNLSKVILPDSLHTIGDWAFGYCTSLEKIHIPNSVAKFGSSVFYHCDLLKEITLPDGIFVIGSSIFAGCSNLEAVHLPVMLKEIPFQTFHSCSKLKEINIPSTIELIAGDAFNNCDALTVITIPSLKTIGNQAFYDCDALKTVKIGGVNSIGTKTFSDCDVLENVDLGDYLGTLGANAFRKCSKLTTVNIPSPLSSIPDYAFADSVKLANVYIPDSVTTISTTAFSYPGVTTLHGGSGSAAESYALTEDFDFEATDNYVSIPLRAEKYANGEIKLIWDAAEGVNKYSVAYLDTNSIYRPLADNITNTNYDIGDLTWSGTGKFFVRAYKNNRYSDYKTSDYLSISSSLSKVGTISSVTDKSADTSITLSWTSATNAKGYIVYLKGGDTWEEIGRTESSARQFTIDDLVIDQTYEFAICGYFTNGNVTVFGEKKTVNLTFTGKQVNVKSISILKAPTKTKYYVGDELDVTDGIIKVTYDDNSTGNIDMTPDMVSGFKPTTTGTQTLTVKYKGFSVTLKVTVEEPKTTSISVSTFPKTKYYLDDPLDISGGKITVTYANGNTDIIDMTASMVSGFASNKTGTFELTVTYGGCKTKYSISVSIDPTNAKVVLTGDGVNDNFTTLSEAFAKITSLKNNNGIYTITVSKNITEKSIVLPKAASEITIVTENNAVIYTTSASLSAFCDLAIDAGIIHTDTKGALDGKKIAVKIPKDCSLTLVKEYDNLGAVSGTATSTLIVKNDIIADSVATFGTVNIADGKSLTVNTKMSGIGTINGSVSLSDAAKSSAVVTNAGNAAFRLTQGVNSKGTKILPKLTVTDVAYDLTITVVDGNGDEVDLESGTSIMTAGNPKIDFTKKIKIENLTGSDKELNAFVYTKDIRAEYAGAITLNGDNYPNFEQAFAHLKTTGENELIINDDLAPVKFTLPTKAEQLTIRSEGDAKTITLNKVTSLAPSFSLTLDNVNIISEGAKTFAINGKKDITLNDCSITPVPAVKVGMDSTLTLSGDVSELGALGGTKSSKLDVKSDVTAASIATFGNVEVGSGYTLTAEGKVSAVTKLDGTLKIANAAKATTAAVTDIGDAKIILTSEAGVLAKTTINDIITGLEVEIVDTAGNTITVPSGTAILTSGGKSDFTDKITVSNNDSDMHELSAFLYKKEIRAEFAGILTVEGNGISRNYPNFETAINAINDREKATKANADYVITINGDTSAAKFTLPTNAGSLTIRSNSDMKTLTLTGTSTLTAKYDLTLENVKVVNLNTKNAESALTISQTAGTLVLDNVVCNTLSTVKGTAKSALDLYSCSIIDTISGFGTVNIYENATAGKNFNVTALNIAAGKGITVPSGKTITAKAVYGAADSFIKLEPGFKPLAFSGTVDGTIKLISDSAIAETVQILNSAKASLGVFDVSGITPDDGLDYALTRTGAKVFCKEAKLGFNGKKFVTFADICTEIENAKNASANYTVEVLADFDSGAALKFPKAGTYYSLTITSDNKKLSFTGSLTPTGNTVFENIDLSSVTAKGAAKYTITGAKNSTLTIYGCDLGLVTAIGAATTDVNISNVKFANGQAVKLTADELFFRDIDGITESIIANTIKADGAQTLKLLEKKTSQIKTGMTNDSGKITINIVTAAGADAALKKGTVIFSAFKGESFNADLANDGFVLSRDARTFKVTIAA